MTTPHPWAAPGKPHVNHPGRNCAQFETELLRRQREKFLKKAVNDPEGRELVALIHRRKANAMIREASKGHLIHKGRKPASRRNGSRP